MSSYTTHQDDGFVDRVILSALGALDGGRVTHLRPDGYSLPMGDDDAFDFEAWALLRYEAALAAFTRNPRVQRSVTDLARATYWQATPLETHGRFAPLLARTLASLRKALARECETNPLPSDANDAA